MVGLVVNFLRVSRLVLLVASLSQPGGGTYKDAPKRVQDTIRNFTEKMGNPGLGTPLPSLPFSRTTRRAIRSRGQQLFIQRRAGTMSALRIGKQKRNEKTSH